MAVYSAPVAPCLNSQKKTIKMAGFTDKRFTAQTTVNPDFRSGLVGDGGAKAFKALASAFDSASETLWRKTQEEDARRGGIAGQNSVIIGPDGAISHSAKPDDVTTRVGREAFEEKQRQAILVAHQNAIRNMLNKTLSEAMLSPDPVAHYTEASTAFIDEMMNGVNPDVKGMLMAGFASQFQAGINKITEAVRVKAENEAIETTNINLDAYQSNIIERIRQGADTEFERRLARVALDMALRTKRITKPQYLARVKSVALSEVFEKLVSNAEKSGSGYAEMIKQAKVDLEQDDFGIGFDMTIQDRDKTMNMFRNYINLLASDKNVALNESEEKMAIDIYEIAALVASGKGTEADVDAMILSKGYDKEELLRTSPTFRRMMITIIAKTYTRNELEGKLASDTAMADVRMEMALDPANAGFIFTHAQFLGVYDRDPGVEATHLLQALAFIKSDMAEKEVVTEEGYETDLYARAMQYQLSEDMVDAMAGDRRDPVYATWVRKNRKMIHGWIKDAWDMEGTSRRTIMKVKQQILDRTPVEVTDANVDFDYFMKMNKRNDPNWPDEDTPEWWTVAFLKTAQYQVIPDRVMGLIDKAITGDQESGFLIAHGLESLSRDHGGLLLLDRIPQDKLQVIAQIQQHFGAFGRDDLANYDRFWQNRFSRQPEMVKKRQMADDWIADGAEGKIISYFESQSKTTDLFNTIVRKAFGQKDSPYFDLVRNQTFISDVKIGFDPIFMDAFKSTMKQFLPQFIGLDDYGIEKAIGLSLMAMGNSGYGISKYSASRFVVDNEGNLSQDGTRIRVTENAFEKAFPNGESEVLMADFLQTFFSEPGVMDLADVKDMPPAITHASIYNFEFSSLMEDGWIVLIAQAGSTKDRPVYSVHLSDPNAGASTYAGGNMGAKNLGISLGIFSPTRARLNIVQLKNLREDRDIRKMIEAAGGR